MKQYWLVIVAILGFFLCSFILIEQLQIPFLTNPDRLMQDATSGVAILSVSLLIADVFIPVPSSVVMILNGALFGIFPGGVLSLFGTLGAAWLGFYLGRLGTPWMKRWVSEEQLAQANALLETWGLIAIIVTRPVPILAETMTIAAGASRLTWRQITAATVAGSLPMVVLYAIAGATAATFNEALISFGLVLVIAAGVWLMRR
jgi:uncharacterized membrane protein YdjX (TVP38/TMEM64 family)